MLCIRTLVDAAAPLKAKAEMFDGIRQIQRTAINPGLPE